MLDRLIGTCFGLLLGAVAIYVAVGLIESIAGPLITIAAIAAGVLTVGFLVRLWWQRQRLNRW
jgi:hypothetical protein